MKIRFHSSVGDDVRSLISSDSPKRVGDSLPRLLHSRQRGVALIITLILLSVTLLMALAFLAVSNRARNAANTASDTSNARLAADAALASAEAQAMANILSATNPYNFGLLVSTNYISSTGGDVFNYLTNLFILPRVPVFISQNGTNDFRYYYDLNRNGVDDPGFPGQVGDPEWIGLLEHPDRPHGPLNNFIARFMFYAVPIGNGLDLNYIHNQVLDENNSLDPTVNPPPAGDTFFRNQGVGSSELNLAAFLADLNTNSWTSYNYNETSGSPNSGTTFDDARAMLAYRYGNNYNSLASAPRLLNGAPGFDQDNIDGYSDGPLQTTTAGINESIFANQDKTNLPWAGADNTNHFFTIDELFDPNKSSIAFTNRLLNAGNGASPYDHYTFYRLLSQSGTDSSPESGKMNLNYDNLDPYVYTILGVNYTNPPSATNFMAWTPLGFFTNAADRLLKTYTAYWAATYEGQTNFLATFNVTAPFDVTHIPVWVSNRFVYTPAVNRLLQLAANIYDATTTNYFPSVFRPIFSTNIDNGYVNLFITGYTNAYPTTDPVNDQQMNLPVEAMNVTGVNVVTNVYGVPWIIGAKKGFPNFNSFTFETAFTVIRKLRIQRQNTNDTYADNPDHYTFSQQVSLGVTNLLQVECWNSYQAAHAGQILVFATDIRSGAITNDAGVNYPINPTIISSFVISNTWPGSGAGFLPQKNSFARPLYFTNVTLLPCQNYTFNPFAPFVPNTSVLFFTNAPGTPMPMPEWGLQITNRLRVVMVESNAADGLFHVIDYVQLAGPDIGRDVSADIRYLDIKTHANTGYDDQWVTNVINNIPGGISYQFEVSSANGYPIILSPYFSQQSPVSVTNQINGLRGLLGSGQLPGTPLAAYNSGKAALWMQAAYTPSALVSYKTRWEANDPLVHYLGSDLTDNSQSTGAAKGIVQLTSGNLNTRYMPWGGRPTLSGGSDGTDPNPYNSALKDPLVKKSDNWDFPTGKLPTVGWLGRVHRGTPWQTVDLKSSTAPNTTILTGIGSGIAINLWMWQYVSGNLNFYDASNSVPTQDRLMFDLFTTAFNDNASRGQLSVNVGAGNSDPNASLASWSALFSGMVVPTNSAGGYAVIQPAGIYDSALPLANQPPLAQLAAGIVQTRANHMNPDGVQGVFERAGSILGTPQLTEQSPYLAGLDFTNAVTDEMVEWLPQQMMSLVRVGSPRYVIYSYGQTLKPAQGGIYNGTANPAEFGLVTNYQVVAEIATRAVVRFDAMVTNIPTASGVITVVTNNRAVIESFNVLPPN